MIKLLSDRDLIQDTPVKIYMSDNLHECRATILLLKTQVELMEKGMSIGNGLGFANEASVIWAEVDKSPIGGICYFIRKEFKIAWIGLSFTDPNWRGVGVNQLCHSHLEKVVRTLGATSIASHVHIDNKSRIASCKKVGLEPTFYRMEKQLGDEI